MSSYQYDVVSPMTGVMSRPLTKHPLLQHHVRSAAKVLTLPICKPPSIFAKTRTAI